MLPPPPKNYKISSAFSYNFILALTEIVNRLIAQHPDKDQVNHFLAAVKTWMEVKEHG